MNFNPDYISKYNLNTTHPIQQNTNEYQLVPKYVSIHSEDRNYLQFPSSDSFEITLPQTLENITAVRVADWTFPANYNTFSLNFRNLDLVFSINLPFLPTDLLLPDYTKNLNIYNALLDIADKPQTIKISEGFYNPDQMIHELENKLNFHITNYLNNYYTSTSYDYDRFKVVYNQVEQNIWFGNTADQFSLNNEIVAAKAKFQTNLTCELPKNRGQFGRLAEFANYGLPSFIGLPKTDVLSVDEVVVDDKTISNPRFFYGDAIPGSGDGGIWLVPDSSAGATKVFWIRSAN